MLKTQSLFIMVKFNTNYLYNKEYNEDSGAFIKFEPMS